MKKYIVILRSKAQTLELGFLLAKICKNINLIYLCGDLGTGKTTLCRGFLHALGYLGIVKSPTYTLIESYFLPNRIIHHFDLYRLNSSEEFESIGVKDYLNKDSLCLVEWPKYMKNIFPYADITLKFTYLESGRRVQIEDSKYLFETDLDLVNIKILKI